jgi:hypothetical protein
MERRLTMGLLAAMACGGGGGTDDDGAASTDDGTQGAASTSEGDDDGSATTPDDDDDDDDSNASEGDDGQSTDPTSTGPAESSTSADDGADETTAGTAECAPAVTPSACGNPNSVVRGTATLAVEGGPTVGNLLVLLNHEYLGGGADGGVPHTGVYWENVELANGPVPFEVDMCSNGEMWSEENCEFVLHVTLDLDADNTIDPGEPTGTTTALFLSCSAESPCLDITLDCTDGVACTAFADPPICGCAGNGESCNSPIVAC